MSDIAGPREILKIKDLNVWFQPKRGLLGRKGKPNRAVDGVSLTLAAGETLGIVGESGSGKSTLGRAVVGLAPIQSGQILVDNVDIRNSLGTRSLAFRRSVQMVFQDPYASLSPRHSVGAIIREPLAIHGALSRSGGTQIDTLLTLVGLPEEIKYRKPRELSGGQCQRVAIARALALNPQLVICDEPTSALDVSVQAQIVNLILALRGRLGLSYLFIAHDLAVVRQVSHRVAVMYAGRILEEADTLSLYSRPRHPYTKALLSAAPVADPKVERTRHRINLPEAGDNSTGADQGCRFRPRCWLWKELGCPSICAQEEPKLAPVDGASNRVACHFPNH